MIGLEGLAMNDKCKDVFRKANIIEILIDLVH